MFLDKLNSKKADVVYFVVDSIDKLYFHSSEFHKRFHTFLRQ